MTKFDMHDAFECLNRLNEDMLADVYDIANKIDEGELIRELIGAGIFTGEIEKDQISIDRDQLTPDDFNVKENTITLPLLFNTTTHILGSWSGDADDLDMNTFVEENIEKVDGLAVDLGYSKTFSDLHNPYTIKYVSVADESDCLFDEKNAEVEVVSEHEEDMGIGDYEYFGSTGYDSDIVTVYEGIAHTPTELTIYVEIDVSGLM